MTCPPPLSPLCRWLAQHRRLILILMAVSAMMYAVGYFAPHPNVPLMCKVYG